MTGNVLDIPVKTVDGRETTLNEYKGRVILIVNVASKCGLTPQYDGLEKLYGEKRERGFVIAAFPANDFKGQEPGTDAEILDFCTSTYDVTFPIFSKISVKGEAQHPLYRQLTKSGAATTGDGPMRERLKSHGEVHLLRLLPGSLPGRRDRRRPEFRICDGNPRRALLRQGTASG